MYHNTDLSLEEMRPSEVGTKQNTTIFPWKDVEACMDKEIEAIPNRTSCPICGKSSEELHWINFSSPQWTWDNLMGRMGPLSICTECHCQVEFDCILMN